MHLIFPRGYAELGGGVCEGLRNKDIVSAAVQQDAVGFFPGGYTEFVGVCEGLRNKDIAFAAVQ